MKFQIIRKNWLRGEGGENSYLLRPSDKKMCCLGFFCLAEGILKKRDILGQKTYYSMHNRTYYECDIKFGKTCTKLYDINDNTRTTDKEKEKAIIKIFAEAGHKVEFI